MLRMQCVALPQLPQASGLKPNLLFVSWDGSLLFVVLSFKL
jgi:hypothetical protein